jgi:hypothetical protein
LAYVPETAGIEGRPSVRVSFQRGFASKYDGV